MIEEVDIDLVRMMENAGSHLAALAIELFAPASVVILAGPGGNGGGGIASARHLSKPWSVGISHAFARRRGAWDRPFEQLGILRRMQVPTSTDPPSADLIVDALIGYALQGSPRGRTGEMIAWANAAGASVLSLDVPSGLDASTGKVHEPCIRAAGTMTWDCPRGAFPSRRTSLGVCSWPTYRSHRPCSSGWA